MNLQFRFLGSEDINVLANVADGVFDNDIIVEQASRFLSDQSHHIAVAIDDGVVVGFASANEYLHPDKATQFWVNEMGVAPTHQRRGIGKRLLALIFEVARDLGCDEVWLGTEKDNLPARALYRSVGGKEEEVIMYTFDISRKED